MPSKVCTKCGVQKDLEGFYPHGLTHDGFHSVCIRCKDRAQGLDPDRDKRACSRRAWDKKMENPEFRRRQGIIKREKRKETQRISASVSTKGSQDRFTPQEDEMVMRDDMTILEIALRLERTCQSVRARRKRIRNPKDPYTSGTTAPPYSSEEDEVVTRFDISLSEMSSILGRSYSSVVKRRMFLKKQREAVNV